MNEYDQPLVSFVLLSYNQENFICDAIKSAFSQTYLPLEIIISDDCSEDSSFEKARALVETYEGPNKLRILRNSTRLGISDHINRVMTIVKGALIVIAAGDDLSRADRTKK